MDLILHAQKTNLLNRKEVNKRDKKTKTGKYQQFNYVKLKYEFQEEKSLELQSFPLIIIHFYFVIFPLKKKKKKEYKKMLKQMLGKIFTFKSINERQTTMNTKDRFQQYYVCLP